MVQTQKICGMFWYMVASLLFYTLADGGGHKNVEGEKE